MSRNVETDSFEKVAQWWAENPMTYSDVHGEAELHGKKLESGTKEYFEELDKEFAAWNWQLHGDKLFSKIFPYERFTGKRVLEVGCGQGTMASVWASTGATVTAIDLNPQAIQQTKRRFELMGYQGTVQAADARALPFDDEHFDYAYSWGVLHHSPDLKKSVSELMRVLKPDGEFGIMLYNRKSVMQWWIIQFIEGFVHYENRFLTPLQLASRYTDGSEREGNPHTWPVTSKEMKQMLQPFSSDTRTSILDEQLNIWHFLPPRFSRLLPRRLERSLARRFGWTLWTHGTRN